MAPPFIFDFSNKTPNMRYVEQPQAESVKSGELNLCPYTIPQLKDIVKEIEHSSASIDKDRFVSDLFECGAIAISNQVDLCQRDKREERYLQIIGRYKPNEQKELATIFGKLYALLSSVVYDDGKFNDYLGELFMKCNLGSKHAGQFFTPYHISHFVALATLDKDTVFSTIASKNLITISDPCCGGGGLLVAALEVLKSYDVNYARDCLIDCSDIDLRCVHMTYLQLSLAGVPAIVKHQDALTRKIWGIWLTPAFMFQYLRFQKYLHP